MITYLFAEKCFNLEIGVEDYMYRIKTFAWIRLKYCLVFMRIRTIVSNVEKN